MTSSTDRVIIEVGLNENQSRLQNRHVPYSPSEIADAARSCYDAGASIVHYHGQMVGRKSVRLENDEIF